MNGLQNLGTSDEIACGRMASLCPIPKLKYKLRGKNAFLFIGDICAFPMGIHQ